MPTAAQQGTGIAFITVTTGFAGFILDISSSGHQRGAVDTTHSGTAETDTTTHTIYRTFTPSKIVDGGTLRIVAHLDRALPAMTAAAETLRLTFPKASGESTAAKYEMTGFMTVVTDSYQPMSDETMRQEFEFKVSGVRTYTAAV